jgi:hypothetical protein
MYCNVRSLSNLVFIIHSFPVGGGGESLLVDAWSLRPSRVWKDGQWIEWSRARERKSKSTKVDFLLSRLLIFYSVPDVQSSAFLND